MREALESVEPPIGPRSPATVVFLARLLDVLESGRRSGLALVVRHVVDLALSDYVEGGAWRSLPLASETHLIRSAPDLDEAALLERYLADPSEAAGYDELEQRWRDDAYHAVAIRSAVFVHLSQVDDVELVAASAYAAPWFWTSSARAVAEWPGRLLSAPAPQAGCLALAAGFLPASEALDGALAQRFDRADAFEDRLLLACGLGLRRSHEAPEPILELLLDVDPMDPQLSLLDQQLPWPFPLAGIVSRILRT